MSTGRFEGNWQAGAARHLGGWLQQYERLQLCLRTDQHHNSLNFPGCSTETVCTVSGRSCTRGAYRQHSAGTIMQLRALLGEAGMRPGQGQGNNDRARRPCHRGQKSLALLSAQDVAPMVVTHRLQAYSYR